MKNLQEEWENVVVSPDLDAVSALKKLNNTALQILLVVGSDRRLIGTITDGDVRRYLLKHGSLDCHVSAIMRQNSITGPKNANRDDLVAIMQKFDILQLPLVDDQQCLVGLETLSNLTKPMQKDALIVFMAGGLGTRLHPLTLDCPKPLLEIAGKPILQLLLENCINSGFHQFCISVNYKGDMIQNYFSNGEKWGVDISYIEEKDNLGTAGSLSLLKEIPAKPIFVVNADILTNMSFSYILDYHLKHQNNPIATVCVRQQESTIPYGVVDINNEHHGLMDIREKPSRAFFINAGIYVLSPKALKYLDYNKYCDMPTFLLQLVDADHHVATFPICEYWLDIGRHESLKQADKDYTFVFT